MLQDETEAFGIGRTLDPNAGSTKLDLDGAGVRHCGSVVADYFRYPHRHELCRRSRLQVEPTVAQKLAPVKNLVGVDSVPLSDYCHRCAGLQRLFCNPTPFL